MGHVDRRQVLRMFGAAATAGAALAVTGCGGSTASAADGETVSRKRLRVGLVAPKAGPYAAIGADITDGFRQYLDGVGSVLGRHPVDVTAVDEGATPATARAAVEQLLAKDMHVIVGVANPAALSAVRDLVEKAKVPLLAANGSPADLTSVYYMWRASYADGAASGALGAYLADAGRYRRAYLLTDGTPQGQAEADAFRRSFVGGNRFVVGQASGAGRYAGRVQGAVASGADVIFAGYAGDPAAQLLRAYGATRTGKLLVGPGSLTEARDLAPMVAKLRNVPAVLTAMNYAVNLDNAANRRFSATFARTPGGQPTAYAVAAYDSAAVLDQALRLITDDITAVEINRGISSVGEIDSPRGPWTFTTTRTPQQKWYLRQLVPSGRVMSNLETRELATMS